LQDVARFRPAADVRVSAEHLASQLLKPGADLAKQFVTSSNIAGPNAFEPQLKLGRKVRRLSHVGIRGSTGEMDRHSNVIMPEQRCNKKPGT
jgi:hypothetical protein